MEVACGLEEASVCSECPHSRYGGRAVLWAGCWRAQGIFRVTLHCTQDGIVSRGLYVSTKLIHQKGRSYIFWSKWNIFGFFLSPNLRNQHVETGIVLHDKEKGFVLQWVCILYLNWINLLFYRLNIRCSYAKHAEFNMRPKCNTYLRYICEENCFFLSSVLNLLLSFFLRITIWNIFMTDKDEK